MDIVPLSSNLPRRIIVSVRLFFAVSVVDVVFREGVFGMRGISSSLGRIGRGGRFLLFPINICVGLGFLNSEEGMDGVDGMESGLGVSGVWNKRILRSWLIMSWVLAQIIKLICVEITD